MPNINVRIEAATDEAEDVRSFLLVPISRNELPEYSPGSHIDVHIEAGIIRQYSLCGDPKSRSRYLIAVKLEADSRGGSRALHNRVSIGDELVISAPRNNFPLDESAQHTIFLAGGIGITPIISMVDRLHLLGQSFELHYFTRSPAHTAFHDRLSQAEYSRNVHLQHSLNPEGVRNYLRRLLLDHPEGGQLYLCGPKPFMDEIETIAAVNWPPNSVNLEYGAVPDNP